MRNDAERKSAQDTINEFFETLESLDGMDESTATIITRLWIIDSLGRDELLSALEDAREGIVNDVSN